MKLVSLFTDFLNDTVNLNQSRIDLLSDSIEALKSFIRRADLGAHIKGFEEQGSWAHDTIIRPVDNGEFDADLLLLVEPVSGWAAADYVNKLGGIFSQDATYGDKAKTWDYCVTITYAGERKIDIAPCVVGRLEEGSLEVCNRITNEFRRTEPVEYTKWLRQQNSYSGSNSFRKVIRLVKYLRDIKGRFSCPSVLLTTLLGYQISWLDKDSDAFQDMPTALRTVIGRLDDWLQANQTKPRVENPKLSSENLSTLWTDEQYANFRSSIHRYRGWIDAAMVAEDRGTSIEAWQRLFGEEFAKGSEIRVAAAVSEGLSKARQFLMSTAGHLNELVDVVKSYGISILPSEFSRPPHMQPPHWRSENTPAKVDVIAHWHPSRNAEHSRFIRRGEVLAPKGGLWFDAHVNGSAPVPDGYRVEWRITNTGVVAFARKEQRGGFYPSQRDTRRWEDLSYRGVHIAEAFVVRMRDEVLVGQSDPFFVVIE